MTRALTFAEDLCLLLQDDALGDLHPLEGRTLGFGLATAALLELAHHDRIDTDLTNLLLVDPKPLGDPIADPALALIAGKLGDSHPRILDSPHRVAVRARRYLMQPETACASGAFWNGTPATTSSWPPLWRTRSAIPAWRATARKRLRCASCGFSSTRRSPNRGRLT